MHREGDAGLAAIGCVLLAMALVALGIVGWLFWTAAS